jgi:prepilin-type N-terminal cleavage/methylation domain-containing protein
MLFLTLLDKDSSALLRLYYMKHILSPSRKGFTLIELLVVIGILAVLLAITLIAINPARQFAMANNTKRSSDANAILNAVGQYMADHRGVLPAGVPTTTALEIGGTAVTQANICADLITTYIAALPVDPQVVNGTSAPGTPITNCTGTFNTGYSIVKSASDGRITVTALTPELTGVVISVTR